MTHARDGDNVYIPSSVKTSGISEIDSILSEENKFKIIKIKITELNEIFTTKVYNSDQHSIRNFPSYIELNSATSAATYNQRKSAISQHLKNKPKYMCNLTDQNKLPIILHYFTSKKIMSLNMDYSDNNEFLLSFMLSPYKESVFFEDIGHNYDCHFSISLTSDITDVIGNSLFLCKYTLHACYT